MSSGGSTQRKSLKRAAPAALFGTHLTAGHTARLPKYRAPRLTCDFIVKDGSHDLNMT
jgi:hypothetical protein